MSEERDWTIRELLQAIVTMKLMEYEDALKERARDRAKRRAEMRGEDTTPDMVLNYTISLDGTSVEWDKKTTRGEA